MAQPIRKLNTNEHKELKGQYDQMLRQLRIFFRDLLSESFIFERGVF